MRWRGFRKHGPIAIFIEKPTKKSKERKQRFREFLELAKQETIPREQPVSKEEWTERLCVFYGAKEVPITRSQEWCLKRNIIPNFFPELLPFPVQPPKGAGKRAILDWAEREEKENGAFIDQLQPEKIGLRFHVHQIPEEKKQRYLEEGENLEQDLLVLWEEKTRYMMVTGPGNGKLADELMIWRGVTQEDIDQETPVFFSYVSALRNAGLLKSSEEMEGGEKI
ncbi:hypothetical protein [Hominifimenecus sp. rT4P-3]|uniref:hypothetical protein n=1 Tax=Hominifimenecus sp. rT4P-3 TaxID=3242979 RepID=UPI003DA4786D